MNMEIELQWLFAIYMEIFPFILDTVGAVPILIMLGVI